MTVTVWALCWIAVLFHLGSLCICSSNAIRKNIPGWLYLSIIASILAMIFHRAMDLVSLPNSLPGPGSALVIAIVFYVCALKAQQAMRHSLELIKRVYQLKHSLHTLHAELENRGHLAERLAVILNSLRNEIDYYEHLASNHQLPVYKNEDKDKPPA